MRGMRSGCGSARAPLRLSNTLAHDWKVRTRFFTLKERKITHIIKECTSSSHFLPGNSAVKAKEKPEVIARRRVARRRMALILSYTTGSPRYASESSEVGLWRSDSESKDMFTGVMWHDGARWRVRRCERREQVLVAFAMDNCYI